jgi:hypothetical protein
MTAYYPVLTDMAAYTISLAMLYGYLRNSIALLSFATLCGCFTWPPSLFLGGLLLLFPRRRDVRPAIDTRPWNWCVAGLLSASVVAVLFSVLRKPDGGRVTYAIDWPLVELSIAVAGAYVLAAVGVFLQRSPTLEWRRVLAQMLSSRTVAVVAFLVAVKLSQRGVAPRAGADFAKVIRESLAASSIREPGIFFVAHVVYFGPIVLVMALLWKRICTLIGGYGVGLGACILLGILQALESESRHVISTFAFVAPFAVKAMDRFDWRPGHYTLYALISLVWSKIWLTINVIPLSTQALQWPDQRFLMNFGHAMSQPMYIVQGLVVLASAGVLAAVLNSVSMRAGGQLSQAPNGTSANDEVSSSAA